MNDTLHTEESPNLFLGDIIDAANWQGDQLQTYLDAAKANWLKAELSGLSDLQLKRYFTIHWKGILAMPESLFSSRSEELHSLIDHLFFYYGERLDGNLDLPGSYCIYRLNVLSGKIAFLLKVFEELPLSGPLQETLHSFLNELTQFNGSFTISCNFMYYIECFLESFFRRSRELKTDAEVDQVLFELNFNNLAYFTGYQERLRVQLQSMEPAEKTAFLILRRNAFLSRPVNQTLIYHASWPSLKDMLCGWLLEEITFARQEAAIESAGTLPLPKLALHLSVAHLACLIRMFYEEGMFGTVNLTTVFKFFSAHFTTTRQTSVSSGSLSKEFYSINQVTAAVMRGKLQRMILHINQSFFPVCLVFYAINHFG